MARRFWKFEKQDFKTKSELETILDNQVDKSNIPDVQDGLHSLFTLRFKQKGGVKLLVAYVTVKLDPESNTLVIWSVFSTAVGEHNQEKVLITLLSDIFKKNDDKKIVACFKDQSQRDLLSTNVGCEMVEWNAEYTEFIPPSQIFASVETGYCGWLYVPTLDMDESYPIKVAFQVPQLAQPLNVVSVYVKADTKIREIFEELKKQKQVFDPENYELLKLEDGALVLEETVYFYKIKRDTPLILAPKTCPKTIQIIDKDKLKELQVHPTDSIQYINLLLKYKFYKENVELVSTSTKERLSENSLLLDYEGAGIETLSFSVKPKFLHKAEAEPREVTSVPFATNRKEHFWYSTDFSQFLTGSLKYGLCNLQEKKESAVELDLKLVNQRDFKEHDFDRIEVQKVSVLPDPSFFANADEGLDFLLFVHGYNVSFQSVVRRTAQIASNFNFHGRVGCYSWPSQGLEVSYLFDGKNVKNAFPYFMEFLELLTKNLPAGGKLHIISHSMGNRLTTRAVELLATDKPEKRNDYNQIIEKLGNLIFAAPDVSQTEFKNRLEAFYSLDIAREKVNTTVYTCDSDKALLLSKGVNFNDRFGRVPVPIDYVSVFEVTPPANEGITSLNHSYIYEWPEVFEHAKSIINNGKLSQTKGKIAPLPLLIV